ncbi:MarR family winged helix-turn-helix transcriptional regulator [Thauera mechernichensis]|uniref:MarR family winged helix-turn-helix transcriptional regulator n=1 Tax=Thauera mechernichensis TaxID=82788 RepID=A0ABW3WE83_9RHOO|nr:MarR family transcriptional regulator [Thauera mechernichensis]MDG3064063.1 MarR family transcriptional regulator [Thauera mechernichensis]
MLDQSTTDAFDDKDPRRAIERFYFAYRAFTAGADQLLEARGLGRVHHRVLYFIGRNPGISVGALIDALGVSKQALNAPLRELVERDLIRAEPAAEDRRVRQLSLSPQGQALEAQLTEIQTDLLGRAFADCGGEATDGWHAVMKRLAAN